MKEPSIIVFVAFCLNILIPQTAISAGDQNYPVIQPGNDDIVHSCDILRKEALVSIKDFKTITTGDNYSPKNNSRRTIPDTIQARFWWAAEQFDPFDGELVQNWLTYPQKQQINLVVNWHLWTLLDYLGRYRFVNQFGTVAREHGYSLNIFNQKKQCLAIYKYNSISTPPKWELYLEKLGQDSLQVKPLDFFKTNINEEL